MEPGALVAVAHPFLEQVLFQVLSGIGLGDVLVDEVGFGGVGGVDDGGVFADGGLDFLQGLDGFFGCVAEVEGDGFAWC